jgi:hypothetical protein
MLMIEIKRLILAFIITFALAILAAEGAGTARAEKPAIVFRLDTLPRPGRKKPLKKYLYDTLS